MTDPRKAAIPNRLETLKALSAENADKLAQQAFGLDAVMVAMTAAAAKGYFAVQIAPPIPIDLRDTPTWKDTKKRLQEMHFSVGEQELPTEQPTANSNWAMLVLWSGR